MRPFPLRRPASCASSLPGMQAGVSPKSMQPYCASGSAGPGDRPCDNVVVHLLRAAPTTAAARAPGRVNASPRPAT